MSRNPKRSGMTYIEVLGALLMIMLVGEIVMVGIKLVSELSQSARRTEEGTRLAENMLTYVVQRLEQTPVEGFVGETDLAELLGDDIRANMKVEKYDYRVRLWPIKTIGGNKWTQDEMGIPEVELFSGQRFMGEGREMAIQIPPPASYSFETDHYSGHFINGPRPDSCLGELRIKLKRVGTVLQEEVVVGSISSKIQLRVKSGLTEGRSVYTIEDQPLANHKGMNCILVLDCSELQSIESSVMLPLIKVINNSTSDVIVKLIGDPGQITQVEIEMQQAKGKIILESQLQQVGKQPYVLKLSVADKKGKIVKELVTLVGGRQDEDEH